MCLGTQGFQIADKRTQDGREWDWSTAFTAKGGYANVMILGILADKTGKNWWNLETGDIQMSGRFQQYASNGVKSLDIFDNKLNLYAWDDDGNYVGSLRSFLTVDKEHKGIELMSDADDQVRLSVKRRDTETEEGQSVFIGEMVTQDFLRLMEREIRKNGLAVSMADLYGSGICLMVISLPGE